MAYLRTYRLRYCVSIFLVTIDWFLVFLSLRTTLNCNVNSVTDLGNDWVYWKYLRNICLNPNGLFPLNLNLWKIISYEKKLLIKNTVEPQ